MLCTRAGLCWTSPRRKCRLPALSYPPLEQRDREDGGICQLQNGDVEAGDLYDCKVASFSRRMHGSRVENLTIRQLDAGGPPIFDDMEIRCDASVFGFVVRGYAGRRRCRK
jgi:hypothetical protein